MLDMILLLSLLMSFIWLEEIYMYIILTECAVVCCGGLYFFCLLKLKLCFS
jgi:hypothetical protein